ncbi:MAG: Ca2+-dependent phosphoinositide-specific phospholipase C [Bacteroidota bacterium]
MKYLLIPTLVITILLFADCGPELIVEGPCFGIEAAVAVNQIQVIGSHNSYRKRTYEPLFIWVQGLSNFLPPEYNPDGWDYDHVPLVEQLNLYGLRSFELDIFYDPDGGQFYERKGLNFIDEPIESGIPELLEPGFKIIHIPDFDYETHHITFKEALIELRDWSNSNTDHLPLFILVEPKEQTVESILPALDLTPSIPYTPEAMDDLDAEIKDIFGENLDQVITPDKLKGSFASVNEAALNGGWPSLAEARGKFFFILDGKRDVYLDGHPGLDGRVMFVYSDPGNPETAFIIQNGPVGNEANIRNLVTQGYMVRTRSDADTQEARTGNTERLEAAFESGAQIISTDYYRADPRADTSSVWTDYQVSFPEGRSARFNLVNTTSVEQNCGPLE